MFAPEKFVSPLIESEVSYENDGRSNFLLSGHTAGGNRMSDNIAQSNRVARSDNCANTNKDNPS
jgi:hypothetical protein